LPLLALLYFFTPRACPESQPNIVIIYADEILAYGDFALVTEARDNPDAEPDRLWGAKKGGGFPSFPHVGASRFAPSFRAPAFLLNGMFPNRIGQYTAPAWAPNSKNGIFKQTK